MEKSRVVIVEDDTSLRQSLAEWLSEDYAITEFESAEAFLEAVHDFDFKNGVPACILLDFQMPGMSGVDLQANLKRMKVDCPIIFISGNAQHSDIIDAWRGGTVDFLLKPFSGSHISQALSTVFNKAKPIEMPVELTKPLQALIDIPISQREAEVLILLGKGQKQSEVAEALNITLRTVKMHRANLKAKLGLNTLIELTRYYDQFSLSIEKAAGHHLDQ